MKSGGAVTVLTKWRHLGFENVEFGRNEMVNVVPAPCNLFANVDMSMLTSSNQIDDENDPSMKGGVNLFTSLTVDAMTRLKEEIESLMFLS
ncbi:unnamed protein product [Lathyrus sativus]|nr:unnamed protein product [Lathyrus sativus]